MHWAETYIGIPWSATGEGPEAFRCWAFVRHVQEKHFGRTLPGIPNPEDVLSIALGFRGHPERRRWKLVKTAEEGGCVLMRHARYPIHVGIWLDVDGGGVLHCSQEAGVSAAPFRDRVVHHALCTVVEPIFEQGFMYSYANRIGKGTHRAVGSVVRGFCAATARPSVRGLCVIVKRFR